MKNKLIMKILCLGAAGKISRESVHDLVQFSDFDKITIADVNEGGGKEVVAWLRDPRVNFAKVDVYEGVIAPELAFDPEDMFDELEKRKIIVHKELNMLDSIKS